MSAARSAEHRVEQVDSTAVWNKPTKSLWGIPRPICQQAAPRSIVQSSEGWQKLLPAGPRATFIFLNVIPQVKIKWQENKRKCSQRWLHNSSWQPQDWGSGCSCCSHLRENKSSPTPLPLKLQSTTTVSGWFTLRSEDLFLLRHAARLTVHLWRLQRAGLKKVHKGHHENPVCRGGERKLIQRCIRILSWKAQESVIRNF